MDINMFMDEKEEFLKRVEQNGCWLWRGNVNAQGYGRFSYGGRMELAHRASARIFKGIILTGKKDGTISRVCSNPLCVNPSHLEVAFKKDVVKKALWSQFVKENPEELTRFRRAKIENKNQLQQAYNDWIEETHKKRPD
jgi:hypothetical protein